MDPEVARRVPAGRLSAAVARRSSSCSDVEAVTLPTACAAGNYAIGYGYDAIRAGEVDFALCGGADAMCRKTFTGFYRLGTIAPERCQPFDKDRKGILTGEGAGRAGAGEPGVGAWRRGARIYAEVLGYGLNCDAHHPVAPDQDSVAALHAARPRQRRRRAGRGRLHLRARHRHPGQRRDRGGAPSGRSSATTPRRAPCPSSR